MIYQQFLHTDKPSNEILLRRFGFRYIPIISKSSFGGWDNPYDLPSYSWYEQAAASINSDILVIDHEDWSVDSRNDRRSTSIKFSILYRSLKCVLPATRIGFYSYSPLRDFFNAVMNTKSIEFIQWTMKNDDMSAHLSCVDVLFPSIYFFYSRSRNGESIVDKADLYFRRNLAECLRLIKTYGRGDREIIPYVWWEQHPGGNDLDLDVWKNMVQVSLDTCGNCLAWGGYKKSWDDSSEWLKVLSLSTPV